MGLRVLGDHPQAGRLGEGDVPETVRDRNELSADEPVPDSETKKKFNVRLQYVAIGLLLRNLWVWLHHFVLSSPRRGGRRYNSDILPVERMLLWLERVAETMYGLVDTIATERDMPELVPS